jgi:hypothetical protein
MIILTWKLQNKKKIGDHEMKEKVKIVRKKKIPIKSYIHKELLNNLIKIIRITIE